MAILKLFIWILVLVYNSSEGFPPDSITGSVYYTNNHAEMTRFAIRTAVGRFITDNNLYVVNDETDITSIVSYFFGDDSDGYEKFVEKQNEIVENVKNQQRSKEAHIHCNSEQIELAHNHIIKLRGQIKNIAESAEPNFLMIRQLIGKCIYTIQAFYSGTNWVEMNGDFVYTDFGVPNKTLMDIAGATLDTCKDCDNSGNNETSCKNNLLVNNILTSGYQTGQDVQPPYKTNGDFGQGKCGFGGKKDTENGYRTAIGGINKDRLDPKYSPHHHLHYQAFYAARNATVQFLIDTQRGILNEVNTDTFIQIFGLLKRHQASFGFVIDNTGSMGAIITQVKKACIDIMTNVLGTANAPSNYILVTFNDPVKQMHRLTTKNGLEMISALDNIVLEGGGDCPEYAMAGLQKAIELCKEKSTIFFYTDAPAKDEADNQTVIDAANEKTIDLRLFLKDSLCARREKREIDGRSKRDAEQDAYSLVAEGTAGTIYRFNTAELGDTIRQISEELFPSATVTVDRFELKEDDDNSRDFPVDIMLNNVKITVIGAYSADDVDVASQSGSVITAENTSVLFESPNKVVVTIFNPKPGIYSLIREGTNHWTINITAQTSVDFHFMITEQANDGQLYKVSGNPVVGRNYTLFVTVFNLPVSMKTSSLRLQTRNSTTIFRNLTLIAGEFDSTYFVSTTLTEDHYDVSIYGIDDKGTTWMRTSPYSISPVTIICKLTSMPDLYINTVGNITYIIENKGPDNDTFVIDVTDDRDLVTGDTRFTRLISSNGFTEITFQILGSSPNNTVTYTVTVRQDGSASIILQESQTIYISPDIAPSCAVDQLIGKCDNVGITTCSRVTWNGQATISFASELSSIFGSKGWSFETSSVHLSPILINASGDCCSPSVYLTVIDKTSNFVRCHLYLGDVNISTPLLQTSVRIRVL